MLKIYDNFLSDQDYSFIKQALINNRFPWYYNDSIAGGVDEGKDGYQFVHTFFNMAKPYSIDPKFGKFLNPIWTKLSPKYLLRAKANLRPRTSVHVKSTWHTDTDVKDSFTGIYYIDTNNGYTTFKNCGTEVKTVGNRLLLFDSDMPHAGVSCTDAKIRICLNLNYIPNKVLGKQDLYFPD